MSAFRLVRQSAALPRLPIVNARGLATVTNQQHHHPLTTETLHTTGKVHSLGHQREHIPSTRGASSNSVHSETVTFSGPSTSPPLSSGGANYGRIKGPNGVWCVAGAAGESNVFGGVPMGAYAVSETFSPAWRRSV